MDAELTAVRDFVGNHLPYDSLGSAALQSSARLRTAVLATRVSDSRQAIFGVTVRPAGQGARHDAPGTPIRERPGVRRAVRAQVSVLGAASPLTSVLS